MKRYLISYEFAVSETQEVRGDTYYLWYESGGHQNRHKNYEVHS